MALDDKFLRNTGEIQKIKKNGGGGRVVTPTVAINTVKKTSTVPAVTNPVTPNKGTSFGGSTAPNPIPDAMSAIQAYTAAATKNSQTITKNDSGESNYTLGGSPTTNNTNDRGKIFGTSSVPNNRDNKTYRNGGYNGYQQNGVTPTVSQPNTPDMSAYTGPEKVQYGDMLIDMGRDYSADYNDARNRYQLTRSQEALEEMNLIEQYRNAKIAILNGYGNGQWRPTNEAEDISLTDTRLQDEAFQNYINELARQKQMQVDAANAGYSAIQDQLDLEGQQALDARNAELRQKYIDSQLDLKTLEEVLAAQGISGGDIQSALLDARTAYAQNYANSQDAYNRQMANILAQQNAAQNQLAQNTEAIRATYGDRIADAYLQRATQKAQSEANAIAQIKARLGYQ